MSQPLDKELTRDEGTSWIFPASGNPSVQTSGIADGHAQGLANVRGRFLANHTSPRDPNRGQYHPAGDTQPTGPEIENSSEANKVTVTPLVVMNFAFYFIAYLLKFNYNSQAITCELSVDMHKDEYECELFNMYVHLWMKASSKPSCLVLWL